MKILSDLKIKKESQRLASLYPVDMGGEWEKQYASLNLNHRKLRDILDELRSRKCKHSLGVGPCSCKEHPDIQELALACNESANKVNAMWHERNDREKRVYLHYFNLITSAQQAKIKYLSSNP